MTRDDGQAVGEEAPRSLARRHPRAWDVPAGLVLSGVLLVVGQVLPGVTIHFVVRAPESYSVMGGVRDLWEVGNPVLAVILFGFSVLFPVLKLAALFALWWRPWAPARRASWCHWLKALGKWSMLDTFVVVLLVGTVQLSKLITIVRTWPEPAVYAFGASILLATALTFRMARLAHGADEAPAGPPARLDRALALCAFAGAACLVLGVALPVLHVEKKGVERLYALPAATIELVQAGWSAALAATTVVLVVLLPLVFLVGLGVLSLRPAPSARAVARLVALERWAMLDVFVLALWLVYTKVSGIADVTRLGGYWALVAAGALSLVCAWRVRRVY
ncbi:MAG: paraquat-inducible protein A [Planctomycetes bacterium]|nr:paraquat-inducible protein A [Planctomycetota bacterium]